jgi:hypothetical protein
MKGVMKTGDRIPEPMLDRPVMGVHLAPGSLRSAVRRGAASRPERAVVRRIRKTPGHGGDGHED